MDVIYLTKFKKLNILNENIKSADSIIKNGIELKSNYVNEFHNLIVGDLKKELQRLFPNCLRIETKVLDNSGSNEIYSCFDVVVSRTEYDWDKAFQIMEYDKVLSEFLILDYLHIGFKRGE